MPRGKGSAKALKWHNSITYEDKQTSFLSLIYYYSVDDSTSSIRDGVVGDNWKLFQERLHHVDLSRASTPQLKDFH